MDSENQYWFTSTRFEVVPGEDEETNPHMYGKQLATWLREQFLLLGYPVEDVIPEDWGWCVMCQRDPFWLWIGCVSLVDYKFSTPESPSPPNDKLLWCAVTTAEIPFFKYLLKRKPNVQPSLEKLDSQLRQLLQSASDITIVDESVRETWFKEPPNGAPPSA